MLIVHCDKVTIVINISQINIVYCKVRYVFLLNLLNNKMEHIKCIFNKTGLFMKVKTFYQFSILTLLFSSFSTVCLLAQPPNADSLNKSFRLFDDEKILEISLRFDLTTYL